MNIGNQDDTPKAPKRCDKCFAPKEVQLLLPTVGIACCRACRYKVNEILDFFGYYGLVIGVSDASRAEAAPRVAVEDGPADQPVPEPRRAHKKRE